MTLSSITRFLTLLGLVTGIALMTGCASNQERNASFGEEAQKQNVVYGQVTMIIPDSSYQKICNENIGTDDFRKVVCPFNQEKQLIKVVRVYSGGRAYWGNLLIDKSQHIQPGMIVSENPQALLSNGLLKATVETDDCHWIGHSNVSLLEDSPGGKVVSAAGATAVGLSLGFTVPVAGVAVAIADRNTSGGVECDGWSYKEAFKDSLAKY